MLLSAYRGDERLADGLLAGDGVVTRFGVNDASIVLDVSQRVLADFIVLYARGNAQNRVAMEIFRQHDSLTEALQFAATHAQEIVGKANLVLTWEENAVGYVLTMAGAGWTPVAVNRRGGGISTTTTYELLGGIISTTLEEGEDPEMGLFQQSVIDEAGNTQAAMPSTGKQLDFELVLEVQAGGAGIYTHEIRVGRGDRTAGDRVTVTTRVAATGNPTIEFTSGGDDILDVAGVALVIAGDSLKARRYRTVLVFDGTNWVGTYHSEILT